LLCAIYEQGGVFMKCPYCDKEMKEGKLAWSQTSLLWRSKEGHFWNKETVYIREPFDCGMPKAYFCEESNKIIIDLNDKE
jgi:hypothetical protein